MIAAGVLGGIGGTAVAIWAARAKRQRLRLETGLTPLLERFCSAVIDHHLFIGLSGSRIALYRDFMVLRAPAVALQLSYEEIDEITVKTGGSRRAVTIRTRTHRLGQHIVLFCGDDTTRVADTLRRQRSLTPGAPVVE